jgi:hypothetical protein
MIMSDDDYTESREFRAPYVRVRGRVSRSGQVSWSPCLRTEKGPKERPLPEQTGSRIEAPYDQTKAGTPIHQYTVILLDYRDQPLDSVSVIPQFFARDQQRAPFVARLPYHEHVQAVALRFGERELGRLTVPTDRPYFTLLRPSEADFIDPTGVMHMHWAGHDSEHPMTFYVRYTHNGRDWLRPGVNLHTNDSYLDLSVMPGGRRCVAQVLATNGYRTSYVQTRQFEVPDKPPEVLLTNTGGPVLTAQGFSRQHGPLAAEALTWLTHDGQSVGQGTNLDVRTLPAGIQHIQVTVTDPTGLQRTEPVGPYDPATGTHASTPPL